MREESEEWIVHRILVGLDSSAQSAAALQTAVDLASALQAELLGLFVEDMNLLRLAELPFATELGQFSATRRSLNTEQVERQLHAQAERARRAIQSFARRSQVPWSFEVKRGTVTHELLSLAQNADLVILGRSGTSWIHGRRLGSSARGVASEASCATMLVSCKALTVLPVCVLFDGTPLSQKALAAAARLVKERGGHLTVFLLASNKEVAAQLKSQAVDWLQGRRLATRYVLARAADASRLVQMIHHEGCGTLVLPAQSVVLSGDQVLALMDEVERQVLLVR